MSVPVTLDNYSNYEISNVYYGYYHYFFGLNSYGNTVIARYGKLPVLKTDEQKENWNSTLEELGNNIKDTVTSKYMYPHGEVVTCGTNSKGYFVILFKYGNVSESLINDIYSLVDNSAKQMGIQDIPVEFGYGIYREEIPLDSERGIYHWFGESTENLSESDIHVIEEYMKRKPEQLTNGSIATYGKIPLLRDKIEFDSWMNKRMLIVNSIREKMAPYMKKEQVISYGVGFTRIEVGIYENLSSEEKTALAKEIYQIIDEEARKQNITNVPVAFNYSGKVGLDEGVEETNLSASEESSREPNNSKNTGFDNNNNSSGDKPSKNNSTPGFSLLGSLTCLYGGWKLRKK
ncbi:hypothetical protein [Methanosarcina sp. UBA289]|uniref:hypothetical protein n=1 Tax=Methanosarcina sp. UBA289 TaxID=1915574 RepID=UPI0037442CC3